MLKRLSVLRRARYFAGTVGPVGNLSDFAKAAINFGRGEFGATALNFLEALPIWGNIAGDIPEKLGVGNLLASFIDGILSDEQKQKIIDLGIDTIDITSNIPNPASPLIKPLGVVLVSMIMFGRKQWDEAVLNILMMGLGAIPLPSGAVAAVQGPVTAAGVAPTKAATNAFERFLEGLKNLVTPLIDALKAPLQKLAFDNGYVDAAGQLTAKGETYFIKSLEDKIADMAGVTVSNLENLQVLRYKNGGFYKPHFDFFSPEHEVSAILLSRGGQRVATVIIYLNTPRGGGATIFPNVPLNVRAITGRALYFKYSDH
jgi:hypothetical protein